MCNACGFYCCASDVFERCGCNHCYNSLYWDDEEFYYEDEIPYEEDEEC